MQPLSGNQRPDPLTSLMNMSLVLCLPRKMHLCRSSSNVPRLRLPSIFELLQNPHIWLIFDKVHNPLRLPRETTSERPKVLHTPQLFALWLEMCFAPKRRALFRHLNFQKWSRAGVFCTCWLPNVFRATTRALFRRLNFQKWSGPGVPCTFWIRNVLRATMACTFSTSQLLQVPQSWGALYGFTSKCALRHNGVQFFISHLASWLRTRCFSEPTFRPSGAANHWKNTMFRDFPTFLSPATQRI